MLTVNCKVSMGGQDNILLILINWFTQEPLGPTKILRPFMNFSKYVLQENTFNKYNECGQSVTSCLISVLGVVFP